MESPSLVGLLMATLMYAISVSPSLLPRRWWYHGLVSGVLMAIGYCGGWLLERLGGFALGHIGVQVIVAPRLEQWLTIGLSLAFGIWVIRSIVLAYRSSLQAAALVQMRPERLPEYLLGMLASLILFGQLMLLVWAITLPFKVANDWLSRWVPTPLAMAFTAAAGIFIILFLSNRVVLRAILAFFARDAAQRNNRTASGIAQPQNPERSGSPASLCSWQSVGAQGRAFLGRGPSASQIAQVTGQPAMEPIRVYAGMPEDGRDFAGTAQLVVQEMHRTGAFDRKVVLISVATGSGWVDEWIVEPVEYLSRGNCATVSMQYSYLFSAAILLSERDICLAAGTALYEAVRAEIDRLSPSRRPLLFVSGESLGAEAAQHPFRDFDDMAARVDGALLVGSPSGGRILRELTARRHRGSPEVAPVFDSARQARFVGQPLHLTQDVYGREFGNWEFPRVVFAQHASDPVVWYSSRLMFNEPDWIRERVGLDVTTNMRYTYFATFWQVACDMPMAGTAPGGHGHTYNEELIPIWLRLLGIDESDAPSVDSFVSGVNQEFVDRLGRAIRFGVEDSGRR